MVSKTTANKAAEPDTEEAAIDVDAGGVDTRELAADNLIKDYVIGSVAASIVPVAFFDIAAVAAIQLRMIKKLSDLYGKPFSERLGGMVIYALAGSVLGFGAGYIVAASATKIIPGIGWMIGMVSLPVVAGGATFAVGRSIVQHYEEGGTLMDFDASRMRDFYKEQFEKGKEFARKAKTKVTDKGQDIADEAAS